MNEFSPLSSIPEWNILREPFVCTHYHKEFCMEEWEYKIENKQKKTLDFRIHPSVCTGYLFVNLATNFHVPWKENLDWLIPSNKLVCGMLLGFFLIADWYKRAQHCGQGHPCADGSGLYNKVRWTCYREQAGMQHSSVVFSSYFQVPVLSHCHGFHGL